MQRVPPHDNETETGLLGAALLSRDGATLVSTLDADVFYLDSNRDIARAMSELVAEGKTADTGMVIGRLRDRGQLDGVHSYDSTIRGSAYVQHLMRDAPGIGALPNYADRLVELHRQREVLRLAQNVVDSVYARTDTAGLVAEMQATIDAGAEGIVSSWEPVNLAAILAGDEPAVLPAFLLRSDGQAMLYPGKLHAFNAEPESGKSWLALRACLEVVEGGGHVLYVDFEDSASTAVERLLAMGADTGQLLDRFHYVRPEDPLDTMAVARVKAALAAWEIRLCVVDGVGEAMALSEWNEDKAPDYYAFVNRLPRVAARAGAAVITIDHVTKDPEKRGGYGVGSGAKKRVTDVAFELVVSQPFGRDRHGVAKLWVRKDRHGHLRGAAAEGKFLAELHVRSSDGGACVSVELRAPESSGVFRPTHLMQRVSSELEQSPLPLTKRVLRSRVGGKVGYVDSAIERLVAEGYIRNDGGGFRSLRAFGPESEDEQNDF